MTDGGTAQDGQRERNGKKQRDYVESEHERQRDV